MILLYIGCKPGETITGKPLFMGKNKHSQLKKIFKLRSTPTALVYLNGVSTTTTYVVILIMIT